MNLGRPVPLHRQNEDLRMSFFIWKSTALADGVITPDEHPTGFEILARLFGVCELQCERDEHRVSADASPLGIRGHRPERLVTAALKRPLPSNIIELFPERGDAA